jgi:hypothetical protein
VTFFPRSRRCWKPFPASGTTSLSGAGGLLIWIKDYLERPLGVIRDRVEPSGKSGHVRYAAESRSDADAEAPSGVPAHSCVDTAAIRRWLRSAMPPIILGCPFAIASFRSTGTLWLPKSNAGPSAIFRDELDPGRLQRALNRFEVVFHRNRSPCLEISNGTLPYFGFGGQVGLRKLNQGAGSAALRRCHPIFLRQITIFNKDTE